MQDRAVLDTGVIVAVYFKEKASSSAKRVAMEHSPVTVDLAFAEVGNAAWKRVVLFGEDRNASQESLIRCLEYIRSCTVLPSADLAGLAFEIAVEDRVTFYDALFLAAAEQWKLPLYTLDKKLYEKVKEKRNVQMVI
jgi:predicted nucleic acid-binding protein